MRRQFAMLTAAYLIAASAAAQEPRKETVNGVTNFARVETTVACAGATTADAVPELKKMGFASIINLRLPDEKGQDTAAEEAAANAAGIKYVHIPFNGSSPDPAVVDQFLDVVTTPANEPAYIHCASGNRAAALWMAKRLVVDHWDVPRAETEARGLGLTSSTLKDFAETYALTHKR